MKIVRALLLIALTACQSSLAVAPPDALQSLNRDALAPPSRGHLYVSFYDATGGSDRAISLDQRDSASQARFGLSRLLGPDRRGW